MHTRMHTHTHTRTHTHMHTHTRTRSRFNRTYDLNMFIALSSFSFKDNFEENVCGLELRLLDFAFWYHAICGDRFGADYEHLVVAQSSFADMAHWFDIVVKLSYIV